MGGWVNRTGYTSLKYSIFKSYIWHYVKIFPFIRFIFIHDFLVQPARPLATKGRL